MTPLMLLACAGAPSSLFAPTLSADRWDQAALRPPTSTVCAGTGDFDTIQDAIDAASDRDRIEVCAGTYDEDIVIEKPLTLITDGGTTTINGSGTTSVVSIDTRGRVTSRVTIEGFVIQGGAASDGGGIAVTGAEVDISLNEIANNVATGSGGGIWLHNATGTVSDNEIRGNEALEGGGIAAWEAGATIEANAIHDNHCTTTDEAAYGTGAGGGGVFVSGGGALVDNDIYRNDSTLHGGGGFFYSAYDEVSRNRVYDNTSAGDGGGFFLTASGVAFTANELFRNHADGDAGGMHADGGGMLIEDNDFHDNDTAGDGGGLQLSMDQISIVRGNTFEYNVAAGRGGGVQLDNDYTYRMTRSTFIGNRAARGGGLHSWLGGRNTVLSHVTFADNSATECGGAIAVDNQPLPFGIDVATITGNTAPNGAAFCMTHEWKDDAMTEADRSEAVYFLNALLVDNVASAEAGAFHVEFGAVDVQYSTIVGSGRGTLSVGDGDSLSITRTIFADGMGPFASVIGSGQVEINSSLFWNNRGGWGDIGMPIGIYGNISGDPMFVDPTNGDFTLDPSSPASGAAPSGTDIGKTGGVFGW